jgi:hypothetical protein
MRSSATVSKFLPHHLRDRHGQAFFYEAEGTGVTAGVHFAALTANLSLTNADFVVIEKGR